MIKNLVETTFQRASVAADYDELSVIVGKLRIQLNDLRHVLRETHQEMDRMKAELRELGALRQEVAELRLRGVARPSPVESAPVSAPESPQTAPAAVEPEPVAPKAAPAQVSIAAAVAVAAAGPAPRAEEPDTGIHIGKDGIAYWGALDNASARAKAAGKTLIIDQPECISCGTCVEQTDAVFILPDDSKAVARKQEGPMDAIQDAIDACPVTCIHWTDKPDQFTPLNDEQGHKLAH